MIVCGKSKIPYRWFIKWVGTYSPRERKVRVIRVVWSRNGGPLSRGVGWSSSASFNLVPKLFSLYETVRYRTLSLGGGYLVPDDED